MKERLLLVFTLTFTLELYLFNRLGGTSPDIRRNSEATRELLSEISDAVGRKSQLGKRIIERNFRFLSRKFSYVERRGVSPPSV